jgi:23S rRNA pseudouridine2605 synthase
VRLQQYLARAGVASRRASEELIAAGAIRVNGAVVRKLGTQVAPGDRVEYRGRPVVPVDAYTYRVLHKPVGVVTTLSDPEGRRTVASLIAAEGIVQRLVPVGRLDYDTSGVLLLTDDGDLAHALTHPSFGVAKTYRAMVRGRMRPEEAARLTEGVRLDSSRTNPARIRIVAARGDHTVVDLTLHEGRNRQVRRMFEAVGHPVVALVRTQFGPLGLGALGIGHLRELTSRELHALEALKEQAS